MKPPSFNALGFVILFLIALDQSSKYLIRQNGGFYLCNNGISWGIPVSSFLFWIIWIIIILTLVWIIYKKHLSFEYLPVIGLAAILSGALSNALDRLIFNCVIDFIDIKIWPVFNLADVYIVIGGIIVTLSSRSGQCSRQ